MKKIAILLAIGLLLFAFSAAHATLIGVQTSYPDMIFDNFGKITYTATDGHFQLIASDLQLVMGPSGPAYSVGGTIALILDIYVDSSGNLIHTANNTMIEVVTSDTATIGPKSYVKNDVILSGTVYDFGWDTEVRKGVTYGLFDFLADNITGKLVSDFGWSSAVPTGLVVTPDEGNVWFGSWASDFNIDKAKGNKSPVVPEPATMLLLGSGLVGVGVFARRKFGKKA